MSSVLSPGNLLSPAEAAELLGVKTQTLAVWRCSGRHGLPFIKVGNFVKYRRSDLERWLEERTFVHTGEAAAASV
jgi:excisionase family DNA binding protein